jgi:hypothetical protein
LQHAQSLLKQHLHFTELQKRDRFALSYFNYLGHHEFGLSQKPFRFSEASFAELQPYDKGSLDFWLVTWKNYYQYLLAEERGMLFYVSFEDLCLRPGWIAGLLNDKLSLKTKILQAEPFQPAIHVARDYDEEILGACMEIYGKLQAKRQYLP